MSDLKKYVARRKARDTHPSRSARIYSYLNASAGLVRAANHVWLLTVASATARTPTPASTNHSPKPCIYVNAIGGSEREPSGSTRNKTK